LCGIQDEARMLDVEMVMTRKLRVDPERQQEEVSLKW
jgi:hypothetical protein